MSGAGRSRVQLLGEEMARRHGFLGVPVETFDRAGRMQFIALLREGLNPDSKVLEIGCGVLRVGYWLVRFLDPDGYCGIEPARDRVALGRELLLSPELVREKRPRFDAGADFDTSVFGTRFDFFLAGSVWTHAAKRHIRTMLDGFLRDSSSRGVFLTSYLRAPSPEEDYRGEVWVGTSHDSRTAGVIRHSYEWIAAECLQRGLQAAELPGEAFDGQTWIRIHRTGAHPNASSACAVPDSVSAPSGGGLRYRVDRLIRRLLRTR